MRVGSCATYFVLLLVACQAVTPPPRAQQYAVCISQDLNPCATVGQLGLTFRWPSDRLPVRYYVHPNAGPVRGYVSAALPLWERQFLYGEFRGIVVEDSGAADVWVTVIGATPPDVPLNDAPPATAACQGRTTDTIIDGTRLLGPMRVTLSWDGRFPNTDVANCLARVTAHELGHTLGLFGHSADTLDLMHTLPTVKEPSLQDRETVELLYHMVPDLAPPARTP